MIIYLIVETTLFPESVARDQDRDPGSPSPAHLARPTRTPHETGVDPPDVHGHRPIDSELHGSTPHVQGTRAPRFDVPREALGRDLAGPKR
jgi:hypothetical protein